MGKLGKAERERERANRKEGMNKQGVKREGRGGLNLQLRLGQCSGAIQSFIAETSSGIHCIEDYMVNSAIDFPAHFFMKTNEA